MVVTTLPHALTSRLALMEIPFQGCGKHDASLTLYRMVDGARAMAVSMNYSHISCGYRPPSKFADGILLCDDCRAKFQLPAFDSDEPLR